MTTARAEQTHSDRSLWLKWVVATTASYAIGVAINGALGEVVGEALGGEVLHKLGHTVGMGLFGAIVVLAQWPVLQQQVDWAGRWAVATIMGYSLGVLVYGSVLVLAPRATPIEVELALTTFVPLGGAALAQWLALRQQVAGAGRWALAYVVLFVVGWIVPDARTTAAGTGAGTGDEPGTIVTFRSALGRILRSESAFWLVMIVLFACLFTTMTSFQTTFAGARGLDFSVYYLSYTAAVIISRFGIATFTAVTLAATAITSRVS